MSNTTKTVKLNYYADPSHGWVKISKKKLYQLGIAGKISHYSYMTKDYVFLEEDNDLGVLIDALKLQNIELQFSSFHTNRNSKIRNYNMYIAGY